MIIWSNNHQIIKTWFAEVKYAHRLRTSGPLKGPLSETRLAGANWRSTSPVWLPQDEAGTCGPPFFLTVAKLKSLERTLSPVTAHWQAGHQWLIMMLFMTCHSVWWPDKSVHLEPWYPWYHSWNYDIIVLTYDIIGLTYDIIGHDIIVLWYHTYDIITYMTRISYMMSWYDFIFHGYDIICVMISYPWIYDIIVLWYHRSMIS